MHKNVTLRYAIDVMVKSCSFMGPNVFGEGKMEEKPLMGCLVAQRDAWDVLLFVGSESCVSVPKAKVGPHKLNYVSYPN